MAFRCVQVGLGLGFIASQRSRCTRKAHSNQPGDSRRPLGHALNFGQANCFEEVILRLGTGWEFMLGLEGIETEALPGREPPQFPETFASVAPKGHGRRIPAGKRRVLPVFRCAGPRRRQCTPCPCSAGSALAERWSWGDSLKSLPFLHHALFMFRLGHGGVDVLAGRVRQPTSRIHSVNAFQALRVLGWTGWFSYSSAYCGGFLPTFLVTFGYCPAGTFSSMAVTSIWCHQSSPKSNQ